MQQKQCSEGNRAVNIYTLKRKINSITLYFNEKKRKLNQKTAKIKI